MRLFSKAILLVGFLVHTQIIYGQKFPEHFRADPIDTSYIEYQSDRLITNLLLLQKHVRFSLFNASNSHQLDYLPNGQSAFGLSLSYKWLGIGFSHKLPLDEKSLEQYGRTQSIDFQINATLRRWIIDGYFQFYNGFYVDNISDFYSTYLPNCPYPKVTMNVGNIGLAANYIVNYTRFSYRSAFTFSEIQKKSSGSLIPGIYLFVNSAAGDSTLLPDAAHNLFPDLAALTSVSSLLVGVSVGYGYNFVIRNKFYVSLSLLPGIGLSALEARDTNQNKLPFDAGATATLRSRFSAIYRKNAFYAGLWAIHGTNTILGKSEYSVSFGYGITSLVLGYNFDLSELSVIKHL